MGLSGEKTATNRLSDGTAFIDKTIIYIINTHSVRNSQGARYAGVRKKSL